VEKIDAFAKREYLITNNQGWRDAISSSTLVVKVGTEVLTRRVTLYGEDRIKTSNHTFHSLAGRLQFLREEGVDVVLVSSGAVACGRMENQVLHREMVVAEGEQARNRRLEREDTTLEEAVKVLKQRAAAIGQTVLMGHWRKAFKSYGTPVEQILVDDQNIDEGVESVRSALKRRESIAIVNGNDAMTIGRTSLCGDNDRLARLIGVGVDADVLLMITKYCSVLDGKRRMVHFLDAKGQDKVYDFGKTKGGSGGICSKVDEAKLFAQEGRIVIITDHLGVRQFIKGQRFGTWVYNKEALKEKGRERFIERSSCLSIQEGGWNV